MKSAIESIIRSTLGVEEGFEITRNTHLFNDLGATEVDLYCLATRLEDALSCSILDEEIERWRYVGGIYRQFGIKTTEAEECGK